MTRRTSRKLRSNRRRPAITSKASKPKKLKMKWPAAIDYDTRVALGLPVHGKKSRRTSRKPVRKNSRRRTSLRRNGEVRITGKQYANYYAMKRGGPSANDGYNIQQYGMTYEQFRAIKRLEENIGGGGYTMTLAEGNALLAGKKVQMARASQSEIDAVAKAFEHKIRKNSRRRTSRKPVVTVSDDLFQAMTSLEAMREDLAWFALPGNADFGAERYTRARIAELEADVARLLLAGGAL